MESETTRIVARDLLNLALTEAEAAQLAGSLATLRKLVQTIETVPLPFLEEPFMTPAVGDAWLDAWPEEAERR